MKSKLINIIIVLIGAAVMLSGCGSGTPTIKSLSDLAGSGQ